MPTFSEIYSHCDKYFNLCRKPTRITLQFFFLSCLLLNFLFQILVENTLNINPVADEAVKASPSHRARARDPSPSAKKELHGQAIQAQMRSMLPRSKRKEVSLDGKGRGCACGYSAMNAETICCSASSV